MRIPLTVRTFQTNIKSPNAKRRAKARRFPKSSERILLRPALKDLLLVQRCHT